MRSSAYRKESNVPLQCPVKTGGSAAATFSATNRKRDARAAASKMAVAKTTTMPKVATKINVTEQDVVDLSAEDAAMR